MSARAAAARGFSLLEALVTLVIVALIVTLLMQALSQSLNLRARLVRHQGLAQVAMLQEQWFRESVGSAMPDLPDGLGAMRGAADEIELVSLQPLNGEGIAHVAWRLVPVPGGMALHYSDPDWPDMVVVPGPLREAGFEYLGADGEWRDEWAPPPGDEVALPRLVRLSALTADGELDWWVPVLADPVRPVMLRPLDPGYGL